MIDEIMPGELDQFAHAVDRVATGQIQSDLGSADRGIGLFQDREIEPVLVAEIIIDHPLVDAGALGDVVDARAA